MHILLAECQILISTKIKLDLEGNRDIVDLAQIRSETLDWTETILYDLIILDNTLPGSDGPNIYQQLRNRGLHTPTLILTESAKMDHHTLYQGSEVNDCLYIPITITELIDQIHTLSRYTKDKSKCTLIKNPRLDISDICPI